MAQYVTLEELKQHLNVDFDTDDAYITGLIEPVQLLIESYLNNPLDTYVKDAKIYNRQIKKFPTEKQNVSLKHILT